MHDSNLKRLIDLRLNNGTDSSCVNRPDSFFLSCTVEVINQVYFVLTGKVPVFLEILGHLRLVDNNTPVTDDSCELRQLDDGFLLDELFGEVTCVKVPVLHVLDKELSLVFLADHLVDFSQAHLGKKGLLLEIEHLDLVGQV